MKPVSAAEIRAAFVNCSQGEAKRINLPRDLADRPWDDLDFLGWTDPQAPQRHALVAERDGRQLAIVLRTGTATTRRTSMCELCLTTHSAGGVSLMVAPRSGPAGRLGNTVGLYLCSDLACSLYLRGIRKPAVATRTQDAHRLEDRIERTRSRLFAFLDRV